MKALIVGNRPLNSKVIELAKDKLVVAADAGADRLLKYNIIPDAVIGDLDSISDKAATKLEEWIISNKNIQKTDLEKAVEHAFKKGATEIQIIGWAGGRIDHTLGALGLAFDSRISLIDEEFTIEAVKIQKLLKIKKILFFHLLLYLKLVLVLLVQNGILNMRNCQWGEEEYIMKLVLQVKLISNAIVVNYF